MTVATEPGVPRLLARLLGLPPVMVRAPFHASVEVDADADEQTWVRTFNHGSPHAVAFATRHCSTLVDQGRQHALTESAGGWLDRWFAFRYAVQIERSPHEPSLCMRYTSTGLACAGFRLPLPAWAVPQSKWTETMTDAGWTFDGDIAMPWVGSVMKYFGTFRMAAPAAATLVPQIPPTPPLSIATRRAIVIGGTGLLGRALCQDLAARHWDVWVVSRFPNAVPPAWQHFDQHTPSIRMIGWQDVPPLLDGATLINLAGENPGLQRWSSAVKARIESSRLESIANISHLIKSASQAPRAYFQASAVGVYGHHGSVPIDDDAPPVSIPASTGDAFRMSCCAAIERAAADAVSAPLAAGRGTPVIALRLGHILSTQGGFLPPISTASAMGVGCIGAGHQWVPWVHIADASRAICWAIEHMGASGSLNIVAPKSTTNRSLMRHLATTHQRPYAHIAVPDSLCRLVVGESAAVALDSQRVVPTRLLSSGFVFAYPTVEAALLQLRESRD